MMSTEKGVSDSGRGGRAGDSCGYGWHVQTQHFFLFLFLFISC